jgi:hypothetical protein
MIANYLITQLPGQMQANDLEHGYEVEDQVGRLATLIDDELEAGQAGSEISQPISLGSSGEPPFAGPDGAAITAAAAGSGMSIGFTLAGPVGYSPPQGSPEGGSASGCSLTPAGSNPSSISCPGTSANSYNFAGNSRTFTASLSGTGPTWLNYTTNKSTAVLGLTGSGASTIQVIGSNNTVYINGAGTGKSAITFVGSYDKVTANVSGTQPIKITFVGNDDTITFPTESQIGTVTTVFYGSHDGASFSAAPTGAGSFDIFFVGFSPTNPVSSNCPYGNLTSSDSLAGVNPTGSGSLNVYLNNSVGYNYVHNNGSKWTTTYQSVATSTCPYFAPLSLGFESSAVSSGSFVVDLHNLYTTASSVAFDSGAVIFAVPGGLPEMVDPPLISDAGGLLSITIPRFQGPITGVSGTSTTILSFDLASVQQYTFPSNGFTLASGTSIDVTVTTPYAAAWVNYFDSLFLQESAVWPMPTCVPTAVCTGAYASSGPLGNVTLAFPVSSLSQLSLTVGTLAVTTV